MSVKAAFYLALAELSFNNTEIALALGLDEKEVRRLLNPRHQSKISRTAAVGGTVKMKAPNGQVTDVPASDVEHYQRMGATPLRSN